MPRVSEQVLIPHSADNLYELVRDIRRYPEFIRWIRNVEVSEENGAADEPYACLGKASVHFKGFDEQFSTYVTADPSARKITVNLKRGPFRHLRNRWQFDPRDEAFWRVPILAWPSNGSLARFVPKPIDAFASEDGRLRRLSRQ